MNTDFNKTTKTKNKEESTMNNDFNTTAKNMNTEDSMRLFAENEWISNNINKTELNNNDLIVGPSGAGKTTGYVMPNLMQAGESYIVADTKNTLYNKLGNYLRKKGYNVKLIDFSCLKNSSAYNPLDYIEYNSPTDYSEQDVVKLASILCPVRTVKDPFWENSAKMVVAAMIAYVLEALPRSQHNMINVIRLFSVMSTATGKRMFDALSHQNPHSFAVKLFKNFRDTIGVEKTWGCISQFVTNALWLFDFRESLRVFGAKSDFTFEELGKQKSAFFLNVSDSDRSMDVIVNVFYTQAFQTLLRAADNSPRNRLDVPVRIILDDFAANTYIPDFDKLISVIRSRGISVSIILQSISQLDSIYGSGQKTTIINNCDHILYLGGQDIGTAEYMATRVSRSPESILNQPIDKAYLITRGQKARLVKRLKVFNVLPESVDYMEPDGKTQCMESEHNKAMCSDGQHDKL